MQTEQILRNFETMHLVAEKKGNIGLALPYSGFDFLADEFWDCFIFLNEKGFYAYHSQYTCFCLSRKIFSTVIGSIPVCDISCLHLSVLQDLSLRGFWLQQWMSTDKAKECRSMIDYLLDRAREGKLKYEYVLFHRQNYLPPFGLYLSDHIP